MDVCTLLSCADLGHVSPGMGPRPILKNNYHVNKKKNHFFERRSRVNVWTSRPLWICA